MRSGRSVGRGNRCLDIRPPLLPTIVIFLLAPLGYAVQMLKHMRCGFTDRNNELGCRKPLDKTISSCWYEQRLDCINIGNYKASDWIIFINPSKEYQGFAFQLRLICIVTCLVLWKDWNICFKICQLRHFIQFFTILYAYCVIISRAWYKFSSFVLLKFYTSRSTLIAISLRFSFIIVLSWNNFVSHKF